MSECQRDDWVNKLHENKRVNEWVSKGEWMSALAEKWMNKLCELKCGLVSDWVWEWVSEWLNKWMSKWMNEWMNEWEKSFRAQSYFQVHKLIMIINRKKHVFSCI